MKRYVLAASLVVSSVAFADDAPRATQTPVERYRELSVSLVSGMDFTGTTGGAGWTGFYVGSGANANAVGLVGLGASARVVVQGFVIGAELSVTFIDIGPASAALYPGLTLGYAIPMSDRIALTPAFHGEALVPTGSGASTLLMLTGELALEIFLGHHGFIEPVIALGDLHDTGANQGAFAFGVGYRLGVVF